MRVPRHHGLAHARLSSVHPITRALRGPAAQRGGSALTGAACPPSQPATLHERRPPRRGARRPPAAAAGRRGTRRRDRGAGRARPAPRRPGRQLLAVPPLRRRRPDRPHRLAPVRQIRPPRPDGWFVRETEWEAAQTVCLWRDASASMRWRSRAGPDRETRARRPAAAGAGLAAAARRRAGAADRAPARARCPAAAASTGSPQDLDQRGGRRRRPAAAASRCRATPAWCCSATSCRRWTEIQAVIGRLAAVPVTGYLLQMLDPAETTAALQRPHPLPRPGARGRHADPARRDACATHTPAG